MPGPPSSVPLLTSLGMSDPDAVIPEPTPPVQPPRRPQAARSQLEADEQYARQLAEQYGQGAADRRQDQGYPRGQQARNMQSNYNEEERSFLDDDLPIIKENLKKGFLETQSKFNGWIEQLRKKIDGEDDEETTESSRYGAGASRRSYDGRRSGDMGRYDADPQVLGDDFAGIQLNDDGSR